MTRKNSFNMKTVTRRSRKRLRVKTKKKVSLADVRKIYKDFVEISIVERLIKYGKVQVDKNFALEIVGKKAIKIIALKKGGIASTANINPMRKGLTYKIVLTDTNFKGHLIYIANPAIKKAVHKALMETNNYYRIAV